MFSLKNLEYPVSERWSGKDESEVSRKQRMLKESPDVMSVNQRSVEGRLMVSNEGSSDAGADAIYVTPIWAFLLFSPTVLASIRQARVGYRSF